MTEANWTDLFSTVRYVFEHLLQLATVVIGGLGTFYAFKAKILGEKNSNHLIRQDDQINAISDKVTEINAPIKLTTETETSKSS